MMRLELYIKNYVTDGMNLEPRHEPYTWHELAEKEDKIDLELAEQSTLRDVYNQAAEKTGRSSMAIFSYPLNCNTRCGFGIRPDGSTLFTSDRVINRGSEETILDRIRVVDILPDLTTTSPLKAGVWFLPLPEEERKEYVKSRTIVVSFQ